MLLLTGLMPVTGTSGVFVSAATRSGLLFSLFAFFSSLGLGVLFPLCTPLCGLVWGIGAGLAAVIWSDPENDESVPARDGAFAGALAGLGALLGLGLGMLLSFSVLGGQQMANELSVELSSELGFNVMPSEYDSTFQWVSVTSVACCLGLANLAIMASTGAGGAVVYASKDNTPTELQAR